MPERSGSLVVKDYGRRGWVVRRWVAPRLVAHELAMLERACGLPGVPRGPRSIDRLALGMEAAEGRSLQRRLHAGALPPTFFDALEGILEGLAARGLVHLDLRTPSNVLVTASGAPVVVDLASAWSLPVPPGARRWFERRALRKLRARFDGPGGPVPFAEEWRIGDEDLWHEDLTIAAVRWRRYEAGGLEDPVPGVVLSDLGLGALAESGALQAATMRGRRAIAIDLPGSGASSFRGPGGGTLRRTARRLEVLLDALRLRRVDLVAPGLGGLVARWLAFDHPDRVRLLVTLDSPIHQLDRVTAERIRVAREHPERLPGILSDALPAGLPEDVRDMLARLISLFRPRDLAAPLQSIRLVGDLSSGPRLGRGASPIPRVPWLAVFSSPDHPGLVEGKEIPGVEVRLCETPRRRAEIAWRAPGELSALLRDDHGAGRVVAADDRNQ